MSASEMTFEQSWPPWNIFIVIVLTLSTDEGAVWIKAAPPVFTAHITVNTLFTNLVLLYQSIFMMLRIEGDEEMLTVHVRIFLVRSEKNLNKRTSPCLKPRRLPDLNLSAVKCLTIRFTGYYWSLHIQGNMSEWGRSDPQRCWHI